MKRNIAINIIYTHIYIYTYIILYNEISYNTILFYEILSAS